MLTRRAKTYSSSGLVV